MLYSEGGCIALIAQGPSTSTMAEESEEEVWFVYKGRDQEVVPWNVTYVRVCKSVEEFPTTHSEVIAELSM